MTTEENLLGAEAIKHLLDSQDDKNKAAKTKLAIALFGLLAFFGAEAVRVFWRQDFGRKGVRMYRLFICFLCFSGLGLISISNSDGKSFWPGYSLIISGFLILLLGAFRKQTAIDDSDYQGTPLSSTFFKPDNSLADRYGGEPMSFMTIGLYLCLASTYFSGNDDVLIIVPFVFCGISVWIEALCLRLFKETPTEKAEKKVNELNAKLEPAETFNEVILD